MNAAGLEWGRRKNKRPELYPCLQCASWHCSLTDSDDAIVVVDLLSNKYHNSIVACFSYLRTPTKWTKLQAKQRFLATTAESMSRLREIEC
uniref:Predicted protein n=1 Tax=Hordeum vulgare subsp. vulgare TaxID=112509 RepID=F2DNW2_HORVV|nr:predicted protein [Hordeum vulgare subsp. vulgare]